MKNFYRQGDVSLHPLNTGINTVSAIPDTAKKQKHKGQFVLAYGEHTGHKHVLTIEREKDMVVWEDIIGNIFIELKKIAVLSHGLHHEEQGVMVAPVGVPRETGIDRHDNFEINPGIYKVEIEKKYNPALKKLEKVID